MNEILNSDQAMVLQDSRAGSETSSSTFFSHLAEACHRFQSDAEKAQALPAAPSTDLESAWKTMARTTEEYATSCLALTRTGSNSDLSRWNEALKAMDSANTALNTVVAKVRGVPAG